LPERKHLKTADAALVILRQHVGIKRGANVVCIKDEH